MNNEENKLKCSFCGAYLFPEDDVVYCPECGAPHHRECYSKLGHCAFEEKHGTAEEYDNTGNFEEKEIKEINTSKTECQMCGEIYDAEEKACPNCNTPNMAKMGRGYTYDFLGGVPADLDLGEGVTADEAKKFVLVNTGRYLPKFAANKLGKKGSWNWLAFLFPSGWFLSRKMYKLGAFIGALSVALQMFMFPFLKAASELDIQSAVGSAEQYAQMGEIISKMGIAATAVVIAGAVLTVVLRVVCGIFGDYFYRNHTLSTVSEIKKESEDTDEDYRKKGGVNFFLFVIGTMLVSYLPELLLMLSGV